MRWCKQWICAAAIAVLAACGGGGGGDAASPSSGGAPQPVLQTSRASTAEIGSAGGVLSVTADNGLRYRLEIPQGALPGRVQITMTPVSSIGNLPLTGGLVGAVELQPSGLRFARKVTLRIGAAAPSQPGLTLAGFSIASGGARAARSLAIARGDEILMLIGHFSTHGAGYGSAADLTSLAEVPWDRTESEEDIWGEVANILFSANVQPPDLVQAAYLGWFDNIVLPMIRRADSDELLLGAAAEYNDWKFFAQYLRGDHDPAGVVAGAFEAAISPLPVSTEVTVRELDWANLAAPKFRAAIAANNDLCKVQSSLAALRNVLFLQSTAQPLIYEPALELQGIDRNAVLRDLCARLVVTAGPSLADPLQSVVPSDLDMTFGLQFETQPEVQDVPVQVAFNGVNAAFAKASPANSNVQGEFTLGVSAVNSSEPVTIFLEGCLAIDGEVTDVCVDEVVARNGNVGPLPLRWSGSVGLAMTESRLSVSPDGNQRIQYSIQLDVSAQVETDLPPGAIVMLPLTNVAGALSGSVTTTIVEEAWRTYDNISCLYRSNQTTVQSFSGGNVTLTNARLQLNENGNYTFSAPDGTAIEARVDGATSIVAFEATFTPVNPSNPSGQTCPSIPPFTSTDPGGSSSETALFSERVSRTVVGGLIEGSQRQVDDLTNPTTGESGELAVTLSWSLAPR